MNKKTFSVRAVHAKSHLYGKEMGSRLHIDWSQYISTSSAVLSMCADFSRSSLYLLPPLSRSGTSKLTG